jgi:hypothetical protein
MLLLAGAAAAPAADINEAYQKLQQAVAQKDAAQVKTLALEIYPEVTTLLATPAPASADDKEAWTSQMNWGKSVAAYAEYSLSAIAVVSEPATTVDLIATLEQMNPKSKYLDESYAPYFLALNKTGAGAKVPAIAEKALANFPENDDLLLVLADAAMARQQNDRAQAYANRLVAALNRHPKPEGLSAADWDRKKSASLARGYWISGVVSGAKNEYAAADRNLRAALPLIQGNNQMLGPALFYLGVANFNIGKMTNNKAKVLEAGKFSDQAANIAGPYQDLAWRNAGVIKQEAAKMR